MKITADVIVSLNIKEVLDAVAKASAESLKDVTVLIANDAIKGSPYLTGNNRRSIKYDIKPAESQIYSTSGYGGFLETGTAIRAATPYFKPALDKHIGKLAEGIEERLS